MSRYWSFVKTLLLRLVVSISERSPRPPDRETPGGGKEPTPEAASDRSSGREVRALPDGADQADTDEDIFLGIGA